MFYHCFRRNISEAVQLFKATDCGEDAEYIDKMTDELLSECKECRSHVDKAQDDLDEWNRGVGHGATD